MTRNREVVKGLIRLADSVDEADAILKEEFPTLEGRYIFLQGMFSFEILGGEDDEHSNKDDELEADYKAALAAIIKEKWRA